MVPSKKKLHRSRREVREWVQPEISSLQAAIADRAQRDRVELLLVALDDLWLHGVPLFEDGPPIHHLPARRAAVLNYWATRTESDGGRAMQRVVSDWPIEVVQRSDTPLTDDEIAAAESRRDDGARVLDDDDRLGTSPRAR